MRFHQYREGAASTAENDPWEICLCLGLSLSLHVPGYRGCCHYDRYHVKRLFRETLGSFIASGDLLSDPLCTELLANRRRTRTV